MHNVISGDLDLQLAAVVILYFPGQMQARRLRRNRRRRRTRCSYLPGTNNPLLKGQIRLRGVEPSRLKFGWGCGDVTAIQGRENLHCYFLGVQLQLELAAVC